LPDAPRMGFRSLDQTRTPEPTLKPSSKSLSRHLPIVEEEISSPTVVKRLIRESSESRNSGWQSDTSHMRTGRTPSTKKKSILKSPPNSSRPMTVKLCQIQPLIAYHPVRPSLICDLSKPTGRMKIAGDIPVSVTDADLNRLATSAPQTTMEIQCDKFKQWPVHVRNKTGITYGDVLNAIRELLYTNVSSEEWGRVKGLPREGAKEAFHARCTSVASSADAERRKGLRRIDLLCKHTVWRGVEQCPDDRGVWTLHLASR